jgi:prepilin-type processing-associated H-X9-DG protein
MELLVILAIVAILMGLAVAAVQKVRHRTIQVECQNHLRQIGLALHMYHDSHNVLPPGCSYRNGRDPNPHMSWCTRLLPFLDQESLWRDTEIAFAQEPFFALNPPHTGLSTVLRVVTCPADGRTGNVRQLPPRAAFTSFLGVEGTNQYRRDGSLFLDSAVRLSHIKDGTSHTLMVGERPPSAREDLGWWYGGWGQAKDGSADMVLGVQEMNVYLPTQCPTGPYSFGPGQVRNECDAFHFWSLHAGGANFLLADGSVHFLPYSAAPIMPALATRNGREAVDIP